MLTVSQVVSQIRSKDWFVTIDLRDVYFHVSILPQHRKGEAYQYRVLPFGLALSPCTFTKCVDAALAPLIWRFNIEIVGVETERQEETTYPGMVWDSTMMQARLSPARIKSILTAVTRVKEGRSLTVKQFQRLLGLMAAASNVISFGLLYMRPLQWWLRTKRFSLRGNLFLNIKARGDAYMPQGPVLGAPCCRVTLVMDASLTGWEVVMSGHPARGLWSGCHLTWHINCLEMLAV
ncbi:hypothetical protein M9458_054126, partial [Cirrhinus mrigala]